MSHFKVRENEIVGGGIKVVKFNLFSSTLLTSYLKTPENVIVGLGCHICAKLQHLVHLRQVKLHFLPLSFSFSHLKTRENVGVGCW